MSQEKGAVHVENRKYPRIQFKLQVHFALVEKGAIPKPMKSNAEDMGAGGMAMHSHVNIKPGSYITLNLYMPELEMLRHTEEAVDDFPVDACTPITILSKVVWCKAFEGNYMLGIQFCDIDPAKKKLLKHFLVEYELDEPLENQALTTLNHFLSSTLKD